MKSSQFAGAYVCHLVEAEQTVQNHLVDGIIGDIRIEIKHATAFDAETSFGTRRRLSFRYLQGGNDKGKQANVYVFVGYTSDVFIYWVIPALLLGSRRDLDLFLFGVSGKESSKWQSFIVAENDLKAAVLKAAGSPQSYRGWTSPDLFS